MYQDITLLKFYILFCFFYVFYDFPILKCDFETK